MNYKEKFKKYQKSILKSNKIKKIWITIKHKKLWKV